MCQVTESPSKAGTYKEKATAAFKDKKWEEAIENFSKTMKIGGKNHVNLSNRAACYLKTGAYEKALADANECIKLKRDYYKGYLRKGAAYHAMEKHNEAIAVYKEGLKIKKDEPSLLKGLAAAKKSKMEKTTASKAVRKTRATIKASNQRKNIASDASCISTFNKEMQRELKIKMAALQAQLELIKELGDMQKEEKMDLLFGLIDEDGDGTVSVKEMASAFRKRDGRGFRESLDRAIGLIEEYDTDGDSQLDPEEFANCIEHMVDELEVGFDSFAEFLALQIIFNGIDKVSVDDESDASKHKETEDLFDLLTDERMAELFKLFDSDGSRSLRFVDVARGIYKISLTMKDGVRTTMEALLMVEQEDERRLSYEQFGRLIMAMVATADSTFDEISEDIMIALSQNQSKGRGLLQQLTVGVEAYQAAKDMQWEAMAEGDTVDALTYARLQKLFDAWDVDASGDVTLSELSYGLRKFQSAADVKDDAYQRALSLLGFDTNGDMVLGRREFAHAIVHYSKAFNVEIHEFIDFMLVTAALEQSKSMNFHKAYGKSLIRKDVPTLQPVAMGFIDDNDDWGDFDEPFFVE